MRRPRFVIRDTVDGQVYVVLIAANAEIITVSEIFPDVATARDNIAAQKRAVLTARIVRE